MSKKSVRPTLELRVAQHAEVLRRHHEAIQHLTTIAMHLHARQRPVNALWARARAAFLQGLDRVRAAARSAWEWAQVRFAELVTHIGRL